MRHQTKKHTLGKAQDQRKALLRSLATELFTYGEIKTTMARAKALRPYAEGVITLAKKGDLAAIRQAARHIYNKETGKYMDLKTGEVYDDAVADKKLAPVISLRIINFLSLNDWQIASQSSRRLYSSAAKDAVTSSNTVSGTPPVLTFSKTLQTASRGVLLSNVMTGSL